MPGEGVDYREPGAAGGVVSRRSGLGALGQGQSARDAEVWA